MLSKIRVVSCTQFLAGPGVTLILGSLGAQVIKVESVQHYDGGRTRVARYGGTAHEQAPVYNYFNRNNLGITLNLRDKQGADLLKELVKVSDVVVENYTAEVFPRFGLDYPTLRRINPTVILLSMPGFGQDGPWRRYASFASSLTQMSGISYLTGYPDRPPTIIGGGGIDPITGMMGAFAVLVALRHRERTGRGQHIDFSQLEAITSLAGHAFLEYAMTGQLPTRQGNAHPTAAPHGCYPCRGEDKWVAIAITNEEQWAQLRQLMGDPAWATEERFATLAGRRAHREEVDRLVGQWTAQREQGELVPALQAAGIAAGAVMGPAQVLADPHLKEREMFEEVERAWVGTQPYALLPFRFSDHLKRRSTPAPTLGQHNREVLCGLLGVTEAELAELERRQVIGTMPVSLKV